MKRVFLTLICVGVCLSICGCSKREGAPDTPPTAAPTQAPAETPKALADDMPYLRDIIGVPETYQATWMSNTGGITINVDARVEMHNADAYPVIGVKVREVTEAEVAALAEIVFAKTGYEGDIAFDISDIKEASRVLKQISLDDRNLIGNRPISFISASSDYFKGALDYSCIRYMRLQGAHEYMYSPSRMHSSLSPGEDIPGSAYDYASALALADGVRAALAPDMTNVWAGSTRGEVYDRKGVYSDDPVVFAPMDAYTFRFTRSVNGVPVTYARYYSKASGLGRDRAEEDYAAPYLNESLTVMVSDAGIYAVEYNNPFELEETIIHGAQLLPFESIIDIARAILPLKYASDERDFDETVISVYRIALGYMNVMKRDKPGEYMLVPVWDFFGDTKSISAEYGDRASSTPYETQLTINAMDGTVIDREYGY